MYSVKCPFVTDKQFIVVHNTGMPSPARNEISYMIRNYNEVSFHDAIDENEIVHGIPYERNAWASGDGHGAGNMHGIHIEICRSTNENETLFVKAEENAAEYIAYLLKEYGWDITHVKKHQDFDGKYCPHKTLNWGWTRFLNMIQKYYNKPEEEEDVTLSYEEFKAYMDRYNQEVAKVEVADWAQHAWNQVKTLGIMDGTRPASPISRQELAVVLDRIESSVEDEVIEE